MLWRDTRILIIEDDIPTARLVQDIFGRHGAKPDVAHDGEVGLRRLYKDKPDLVILDMLLPKMSGLEVLRTIRHVSDVPVVILTAVGRSELLLECLAAGADDYLAKPFGTEELLARSWAVVRRAQMSPETGPAIVYSDDYLFVNLVSREVKIDGAAVKLTRTEFALFALLVRNVGHICAFDEILERVWADNYTGSTERIHVFISQLRKKIEPDPQKPIYILSEHGIGYRFNNPGPRHSPATD